MSFWNNAPPPPPPQAPQFNPASGYHPGFAAQPAPPGAYQSAPSGGRPVFVNPNSLPVYGGPLPPQGSGGGGGGGGGGGRGGGGKKPKLG
ncbi:hypothetical protein PHYBLDRAFT_147188 [Phycomyces blakesleeanus NRRL 1555(-)]|uniref:Uncharacterized protein n=1 Tax=Phycomyces blakesleeanus (strain ATCC 8743b / DSM 1359 / FGSC 10004 / NBRC 33097 / NRRL 1555) TaxID=763407 RepID=A0A162PRH0_PHYB8|nr:hypothetical protein PHYBLDRAFT_147188 [Phycomyces blakesleeanus NRRL 1555(-)]OAD72216.1 hypothetical protein PHYBLDRAFT_147188 [Phycomyces blakesleeanus NRRL 1555(-)]|eukprot:XP_018290256.1 hypothetical protein PHYBLDRAFT_147188 [Phycomyces blakesleeanus NRRL 1555(-)]